MSVSTTSSGPSSSDLGGTLLVVLAAALWGTWSLMLRPTGLSGLVTAPILLAGVALCSIPALAFEQAPTRWDRATFGWLFAYAALDAINVATFFSAMSTTSVAIAALTHGVAPVLVASVAPFVEKERARGAVSAAFVAFTGLLLVLEPWRGVSGDVALGAALGLTSAFAYAANVFVVRRLVPRIGPIRAMGSHAALAAVMLLPLAYSQLSAIEASDVGYLALAVLGPGMLAGVAFLRGLGRIGPARAAVLSLLEPVVGCVVGWIAFGEALGWTALVGAALVLAGAAIVAAPRGR